MTNRNRRSEMMIIKVWTAASSKEKTDWAATPLKRNWTNTTRAKCTRKLRRSGIRNKTKSKNKRKRRRGRVSRWFRRRSWYFRIPTETSLKISIWKKWNNRENWSSNNNNKPKMIKKSKKKTKKMSLIGRKARNHWNETVVRVPF